MMNYFHTDFLFQKYWYDSADNENKYIFEIITCKLTIDMIILFNIIRSYLYNLMIFWS